MQVALPADCSKGVMLRLKEEDERLFMGGDWRIRIEAVEKLGVGSPPPCSRRYLDALFVLDCTMKGVACSSTSRSDRERPRKQELSAALTKRADAVPIDYHA